jgi:hypothetical protein
MTDIPIKSIEMQVTGKMSGPGLTNTTYLKLR